MLGKAGNIGHPSAKILAAVLLEALAASEA
jgi:hypothetical protein